MILRKMVFRNNNFRFYSENIKVKGNPKRSQNNGIEDAGSHPVVVNIPLQTVHYI